MQFVELGAVYTESRAYSWLYLESLVLLPCHHLHTYALQLVQRTAVKLLNEHLAVGLHLRTETGTPVAALGIHVEDLQIIIGIIDQIGLKSSVRDAFHIIRHKGQKNVQTVTVLALHHLGLEGYGFVARFNLHRFRRFLLFGAQGVYLCNVVIVRVN